MPNQARVVARLADFPDGTMRQVEVDGAKILLVRRGDDVFAMAGTCPHAGGPLAEGILDGDRVVCPWHKAAFCITSGACLEPPAVDGLLHIPVGIRDGEVVLAPEPPVQAQPALPAARDPRRFVIIGGGGAGATAAQTLREEGFAGEIAMIDQDGELPYDRTLLSKYVLSGADAGEKSPLQDEAFYRHHAIERIHGTVRMLDPKARIIVLEDGTTRVYDAALIATGGAPVRPSFPGAHLEHVFVLRNRADARHLVDVAVPGRKVVVVGASFIGMEVAASLRERGLEVTVVADQRAPFEPQLGAEIGTIFRKMHEAEGVAFRLNRRVDRVTGEGMVAGVVLTDGEELAADLVVVGLGVRLQTGFLQGVPLREDGGVDVDAELRLADGLHAAGDIAAFPLQGDGPTVRVEHWRVAEQHGRLAARNMLGAGRHYVAVPYFWTIQFSKRLDYVGHGSGSDELIVRGDTEAPEFIAYYRRDGRIVAAAGWNRDQDMAALIALMDQKRDWTLDELHPVGSSPSAVLATRPHETA
ncbi:MAG TPA: FAD-dependent oxidoreductase [Aliidongia sp.]|uniref:FAD-dependent oxidoreductase n=1 Tax=Aliidongia sp. TaxID=1914230 RepID=UPI002DDD072E|nr:FAD-dependent oxidoreductase [Aliidongia sp.]HEV2676090.1 FAD-dependent oxidoreductase [Aliidongia sp.]